MGIPVPVDDLPETSDSKAVPESDLPDGAPAAPTSSGPPYLLNPPKNTPSDLPLEGGALPGVGQGIDIYNKWAADPRNPISLTNEARLAGVRDPRSLKDISNAPAAAETVLGMASGSPANRPFGVGPQKRPFGLGQTEEAAPHMLQSVADAERAELQSHAEAFSKETGVDLPPRVLTPPQKWVNDNAAKDLDLPRDAPVTDKMIDAGKAEYAFPANQAVKQVPDYTLGPKYKATIKGVDLSKIDPEWRPPTDGTMNGSRAFELSSELRSVARGLYDDAGNMNLPYSQRTAARQAAQAHYQAAKAVEGGFREGSGEPQIADDWDTARVYTAKAEAWRGAIDQAGNVSGPKIKRLLGDEPITGPMKTVASAVAQFPENFKSTRLQAPSQPGFVRSMAAKAAPVVGGVLGAVSPLGPIWGTAAGATLGERFSNRLLRKP